jgi:hypothetical protein
MLNFRLPGGLVYSVLDVQVGIEQSLYALLESSSSVMPNWVYHWKTMRRNCSEKACELEGGP